MTNQYIIFPRTSHSRAGRPCRKINICNQSAAERLNTTKSTRKKQSGLSALYLPVVFVLIAIGQQGLLLALHNWLRWEITKQEQIPLFVLGSTCS